MTAAPASGGPQPYAAPQQTKIGPTWIALLVLGIVGCLLGGVWSGVAAVRGLDYGILQTPGTFSEHAHSGEYLLYADAGTQSGFTQHTHQPELNADAFSLTEDGTTLQITSYDGRVKQTEDRHRTIFQAVAQVHVPRAGRLTLTVSDDEGLVILGPSFTSVIGSVLPGVGVSFLGLLVITAAIVLRVRAGRHRRPPPGYFPGSPGHAYGYGYPPPPGWLPPAGWVPPQGWMPPGQGPPPPGPGAPWGWAPRG